MEQNNSFNNQVPPAPQTPEVKLRTMDSDVNSIQKTGGATPTPDFIASPVFKTENKDGALASPESSDSSAPTSGAKKGVVWLVVVLIAVGIAVAGYYYVWPIIENMGSVPVSETETTPEPQPIVAKTAPAVSPAHVSQFGFPNDIIPKIVVSDFSVVSILAALQNEANKISAAGELRELAFIDPQGQPIPFSKLISILIPEVAESDLESFLKTNFDDDFTAYLYFDEKGVWPGYIVKIKDSNDVDVVTLQGALKGLEFASFTNLFLNPPGNQQDFRTGTIKEKYSNRFAPMAQAGASFNYGLFDGRLIINTSYSGLLKALELMGL